MKLIARTFVAALTAIGLLCFPAKADTGRSTLSVVELYTSQACGLCPQANQNFADFAQANLVIALTYPVGYWDYLGWKDTFAEPEFTARQRDANEALGRRGPYTPQMILNGQHHWSAKRLSKINRKFQSATEKPTNAVVQVSLGPTSIALDPMSANLSKGESKGDIWIIDYIPGLTYFTPEKGSNRNKQMVYYNRATGLQNVGEWTGEAMVIDAQCDLACVVLVQNKRSGQILGANFIELSPETANPTHSPLQTSFRP